MIKINIEVEKPEELVKLMDQFYTETRAKEISNTNFKAYKRDKEIQELKDLVSEVRGDVLSAETEKERLRDILNIARNEVLTSEQRNQLDSLVKERHNIIDPDMPF